MIEPYKLEPEVTSVFDSDEFKNRLKGVGRVLLESVVSKEKRSPLKTEMVEAAIPFTLGMTEVQTGLFYMSVFETCTIASAALKLK